MIDKSQANELKRLIRRLELSLCNLDDKEADKDRTKLHRKIDSLTQQPAELDEARKDAERAAIQIANQSRELHNCKTDYEYLVTITEDKNALHQWLNMRASRVAAVLPDRLGATVAAIDAAKEPS